jgi:uncharacterized protein YecE (DUF72 family)
VTVYVGTSGWQYRDWRGAFYPAKLAQKDWLAYFAERFQAVEVNNTFYNLPRAAVFKAWHDRTPADFVFALKMSRYLTHLKRLIDPEAPVERFLRAAAGLAGKRGPILLQLPPNMPADAGRLREALAAFPRRLRIAVEFRDDSWFVDAIRDVLRDHNAALCLADRGEELVSPDWRTADWGYVRFHEGLGEPRPSYSDRSLWRWAERICGLWGPRDDVYAFFNNDAGCCAVRDACRLAEALRGIGREVSRVPGGGKRG